MRENENYDGNKKFKFFFTRDYSLLFVISKSFVTKVLSDFFCFFLKLFMLLWKMSGMNGEQSESMLVRCNNNPFVKWSVAMDE